MNVVILSPLQLELAAVLKQFPHPNSIAKGVRTYSHARYANPFTGLDLYLRETGSGLSAITQATEQAITDWHPAVILLVGTAGSIKDAGIGDLVIADKAYGYDAGNETPEGFVAYPEAIPTAILMLSLAKTVDQTGAWRQYLEHVGHNPKIFYGPIAAGDKRISSTTSNTYQIIKTHYNDTLAVEMESIGFAKTCLHHQRVQSLNIRCISDRIESKGVADADGSQPKAAHIAAAFARGLLDTLDPAKFNLTVSGTPISEMPAKAGSLVNIDEQTPIKPANLPQSIPNKEAVVRELRNLIARSRIKLVLEKLLELTAGDTEQQDSIILLTQRWNNLKREERMGVVSRSEASVAANRITMSILEILSEL